MGAGLAGAIAAMLVFQLFSAEPLTARAFWLIAALSLASIAPAPLLQWGSAPSAAQGRGMLAAASIASLGGVVLFVRGVRHPLGLIVAWLVLCAAAALVACLVIDARRHPLGVRCDSPQRVTRDDVRELD